MLATARWSFLAPLWDSIGPSCEIVLDKEEPEEELQWCASSIVRHHPSSTAQEGRRWVDQPQSALVLEDELFASAREQWQQSSGSASTSGQPGDYYSLLGVSRVSICFTMQQDGHVRCINRVYVMQIFASFLSCWHALLRDRMLMPSVACRMLLPKR